MISQKNKKKMIDKKLNRKRKSNVLRKSGKINGKEIESLKRIKEDKSKAFDDKEIKIEAEFDDGETEVEIKFTIKTTDKKIVLLEISKRTGIDIKKLNDIVKFEEDD